jgi:nitrile hydratase
VNGVHDLGGSHGFGRVPVEDGDSFHADWEKRTFGIVIAMAYAHRVPRSTDESRYTIERLPPDVYLGSAYFERWLLGSEANYEQYGLLGREELEARRRELAGKHSGPAPRNDDPELTARVLAGLRAGPAHNAFEGEPAYAPGEAVRARNVHTKRHTRLPGYARGKLGRIDCVRGAFPIPELAAEGERELEFVYEVRFEGDELWGESAEPNACVYLQLWESYLQPS